MTRVAIAGATLVSLFVPEAAFAHGADVALPTDLAGYLLAWRLDVPLILGMVIATSAYVGAARRVDIHHATNRWPRHRTIAFLLAMAALVIALLSAVDMLSDDLLTVHMVQHLLLIAVAAPLLAVSGIGTLALRVADPSTRRTVLLPLLHSRVIGAITHPLVGALAFVLVLWGSHFTELYNLALIDPGIHAVEHFMYLGVAALFWWPLLSPDPIRWHLHPGVKLGALLVQVPVMSLLAVTIVMATQPLYPAYLGRPERFGLDPLTDQQMAGSLMWVTNDFAFLIPAAYLMYRLIRHEEAEAKRVDARIDRARGRARIT